QRIDLRGRGNSSAGALLVDLNRVAQADSVTLVEVRPDDAEPQSLPSPRPAASAIALTTQTYTIRERGQYERTERFVRDLSLMPTLLRVVAVSISVGQHQPDRPANSALDGTITVQTLRAPAGALADHQGGRR
ncbi:MAG: hypothetical protein ACREM8_06820, partial [Vulcanimicrobiaceae bacterium]